ncbi:MAG: phosphoribosylglycinamide formyltransferase [Bacteroidales bacterium]|nr:phosphoribosylglycinamide formyltransferase [Bacteroidales bacterium]
MTQKVRIAIFASGSGSNAQNIVQYFASHKSIKVEVAFVNNPNAAVIERMKTCNIPIFLFNKKMFYENNDVLDALTTFSIDYIVLAGFLWLVPSNIIESYFNRIVNIHPALLPKFGGKGMFGNNVHEAVLKNRESFSGITIHEVNHEYDKGKILFQAICPVLPEDTVETLSHRIHKLEYLHYPKVIEAWIALNY